ncbi:MAG: LysR family transcriptional regulator [Myxococcales bacterium]|nr:MAG: LysR family transcriptional regulator [Myxococcales bacterium]
MTASILAGSLPNLEAFCRTFETGSFTRAARLMSVTPQATSRSVARLERALGATLFRRTTRSLAPTDAAKQYYERCSRALSLLSDGERELSRGAETAEGRVRISVPTSYGHYRFLPSLSTFAERYPKVRVDVNLSNRNVDLIQEGFDLAIRRGPLRDRTLVARKLGEFSVGVYASSAYLARCGSPSTPGEVTGHSCITFSMPSSGRALPWVFAGAPSFTPDARYRCSEDVLGLVTLARAGVGLIQVLDFLVAEDVSRGHLVEVLSPYRSPPRSFTLIYPRVAKAPPAVRALVDFIVARAKNEGGSRS